MLATRVKMAVPAVTNQPSSVALVPAGTRVPHVKLVRHSLALEYIINNCCDNAWLMSYITVADLYYTLMILF